MLECWNIGIRAEINNFNYKNSFKPIFPSFLPSLPSETRIFFCFTGVKLFFYFTRAIIPIGARPLSSLRETDQIRRCWPCCVLTLKYY
jgi:hypothetical protein